MDAAESGQMSQPQSLAAAQSEGLATASSRSLGADAQPAKHSSTRRSLDKGGSRPVIFLVVTSHPNWSRVAVVFFKSETPIVPFWTYAKRCLLCSVSVRCVCYRTA